MMLIKCISYSSSLYRFILLMFVLILLQRKEAKWMNDFTMCEECDRRVRRGQFCLLCEQVYSESDYETKMMYCTICEKWIHMECEGLSIDEYECLAELPDDIPYICKKCHDKEIWPKWYQEVREEINAGFEKVS